NNAFVNWLTISIPYSKNDKTQIEKLDHRLNSAEFTGRFKYNQAVPFRESVFYIYDFTTKKFSRLKGRTLNPEAGEDQKFLKDYILDKKKNCVRDKAGSLEKDDLNLIINQETLRKNHYDENNSDLVWLQRENTEDSSVDIVPVPVRSIVKDLPNNNQLAFSEYFYYAFKFDFVNFDKSSKHDLRILLRMKEDDAVQSREAVSKWIQSNNGKFTFTPGQPEL